MVQATDWPQHFAEPNIGHSQVPEESAGPSRRLRLDLEEAIEDTLLIISGALVNACLSKLAWNRDATWNLSW